eukprot:CAMPEP_0168359628 /NCGR_PEP_ID=MMETSP0228-20121227/1740_1 /TAXON_ID=133427 /ORGANISM="Protoceratium reticulatum, Strain CCCM 535 (=CCMP 1889)" /LENGTH=85 /DNA_ID=CAMNT_0008372263 /DNA_START=95 /DNA_END=349 /DNA_ORIENTATION=+
MSSGDRRGAAPYKGGAGGPPGNLWLCWHFWVAGAATLKSAPSNAKNMPPCANYSLHSCHLTSATLSGRHLPLAGGCRLTSSWQLA